MRVNDAEGEAPAEPFWNGILKSTETFTRSLPQPVPYENSQIRSRPTRTLADSCSLSPENRLSPSAPAIPKHLAVAESLVANLSLANTNYEHGTPTVKFTAPVESHTDCSGFIDALLEHSYGFDKDILRKWLGSGRPTARRYHDAVEDQKGFKLIGHIQDVLPGDILAVKYLKAH